MPLTRHGVFNLRNVCEVSCVGDAQASHAVSVAPFLQSTRDHKTEGVAPPQNKDCSWAAEHGLGELGILECRGDVLATESTPN